MKVTDWIPGSVKPVRTGFYQRAYANIDNGYEPAQVPDYWDGRAWYLAWHGVILAKAHRQGIAWRGLTEPAA